LFLAEYTVTSNGRSPVPGDSDLQSPPLNPPVEPPQKIQVQNYPRIAQSVLALVATLTLGYALLPGRDPVPFDPAWTVRPAPLVKQGGDPHIRALMRTISAAESNSDRPYSLLYGGEHFSDLSRHPDQCVTIVAGPNTGNCTTAAGRYQFITTTWLEQAAQYHPQPNRFWFRREFNFAPEFQDEVVYRWLSDPTAWGIDLSELLRQNRLSEVLEILSPTWTSLGYGIESNSMTGLLPEIYQQVLQEELQASR
jgi:muramidase (phage lysozyme)